MSTAFVFAQPKIQFITKEVSVGHIYEGEMPRIAYPYVNSGNEPLRILQVKSSCGCYSPSWKSDSTLPGKYDTIRATYNSVGHQGGIHKSIYVSSNSVGPDIELVVSGIVKTFETDLNFYYGGGSNIDFDVIEKDGAKRIEIRGKQEILIKGPIALVLGNKNSVPKAIQIHPNESSDKSNTIKVLKNELATSKLTFIEPSQFLISNADTEIIYIYLQKNAHYSFDVQIDNTFVPVEIKVL